MLPAAAAAAAAIIVPRLLTEEWEGLAVVRVAEQGQTREPTPDSAAEQVLQVVEEVREQRWVPKEQMVHRSQGVMEGIVMGLLRAGRPGLAEQTAVVRAGRPMPPEGEVVVVVVELVTLVVAGVVLRKGLVLVVAVVAVVQAI